MDAGGLPASLLQALSGVELVEAVDFDTEAFVLKGRVRVKGGRYVQVYFNELTGTTAFALIEKERRIWGIDFDNMRGWHLHPLDDPESHRDIGEKTVEEIVEMLSGVLDRLE